MGEACTDASLNRLMALGAAARSQLRRRVSELLREDKRRSYQKVVEPCLAPIAEAVMELPAAVGDYTDFYASIFHATNVGSMFRPDEPLLPNYKYVPIGYHGRASSIVKSGTPVQRPSGQSKPESAAEPVFRPSRRLDYELEMGFFIGAGNALGTPIPAPTPRTHLFGACLLNDWSARDIQAWEYQPLGPFLAKNFATTISPWVVTLDALEPFRAPAFIRPDGDPDPLPYLDDARDRERGAFDIRLEVSLATEAMRGARIAPFVLSRNNLRQLYWTPAQLVDAPHEQRLQPAARRSARHRHRLGPDARITRLLAGARLARHAADHAAHRRDALVPRGRRRSDLPRLVREGRMDADRVWGMPGDGCRNDEVRTAKCNCQWSGRWKR